MNLVLRIFSFLFHLPLLLFFLALALLAKNEGTSSLQLPMFPWTGSQLIHWLLGISVCGLTAWVLAVMGKARWLFAAYASLAFGLAVYGVFFSPMVFSGWDDFKWALTFCAAALVAMVGALVNLRRRKS